MGIWLPINPRVARRLMFMALIKGANHKYIKRVPIPGKFTKSGKQRYRYFYKLTGAKGGKGLDNAEHWVKGAGFAGEHEGKRGHYHIEDVHEDGHLTVKHDESGKVERIHKDELVRRLQAHHAEGIKAEEAETAKDREAKKKRALAELDEVRKLGTAKQIEAAEKRARGFGATEDELLSADELRQRKEAAEAQKPASEKYETVQFKDTGPEPGDFQKRKDGSIWVVVGSRTKRLSKQDREWSEDVGDYHLADAHAVVTATMRRATPEEARTYREWESTKNAIAEHKKLYESIAAADGSWRDLDVSHETRMRAIPSLTLVRDRLRDYDANKELFDRVADKPAAEIQREDGIALAKLFIERQRKALEKEESSYFKANHERNIAEAEAYIADESKRLPYDAAYHARQAVESSQWHPDRALLDRAITGNREALDRVVPAHKVDIGGGLSDENGRWRPPANAERLTDGESAKSGGRTFYIDRENDKVYATKTLGYDDDRTILKVATLTPEVDKAIFRFKEAQKAKVPPQPRAELTEADKAKGGGDKAASNPAPKPATPQAPSGSASTPGEKHGLRMVPLSRGRVGVAGNTFAHKDALKAKGARWDPDAKAWYFASRDAAETALSKLYKGSLATFARLALKRLRTKAHRAA